MPPRIEFIVRLCRRRGLRPERWVVETVTVQLWNPGPLLSWLRHECGEYVDDKSDKNSRCFLTCACWKSVTSATKQHQARASTICLGSNYSIINLYDHCSFPNNNSHTNSIKNGRQPRTTSRRANFAHNNVPLRVLLAHNSTSRSRNTDNNNHRPQLYLDHPSYLDTFSPTQQPLADFQQYSQLCPRIFSLGYLPRYPKTSCVFILWW